MKKPTEAILEKRIKGIVNYRAALVYYAHRTGKDLFLEAKKFSGVTTLAKLNVADVARIEFEVTYTEGNLKIYAVSKDTFTKVWETGESVSFFTLEQGKYRLRLVGDSASFDLKMSLAFSA